MSATTSPVSVEEYLKMASDPDCEFVDGAPEERVVGEFDHVQPGK